MFVKLLMINKFVAYAVVLRFVSYNNFNFPEKLLSVLVLRKRSKANINSVSWFKLSSIKSIGSKSTLFHLLSDISLAGPVWVILRCNKN